MKTASGELTLLSKFAWQLDANPPTSPASCSSGFSYPILDFPPSSEPVKIPKKVPKKELRLSSANENDDDEATVLLTQSQGTQQCAASQPKQVTPLQKIKKMTANTSCHHCGDSICHQIRFDAFLVRYGNETRSLDVKKKTYLLVEKKRLSDDFKRTYHLLVEFDKFDPKNKEQMVQNKQSKPSSMSSCMHYLLDDWMRQVSK